MSTYLQKIDKDGHFSTFPGVTTIASCYSKNMMFCEKLYKELSSSGTLSPFFSFLPANSYHMTTLNLYTEQEIGRSSWKSFINGELENFQNLSRLLSELEIEPNITINGVHSSGVIQLIVSLPEKQEAKLRDIGLKLDKSTKVPGVFHITLAYQYKWIPASSQSIVEAEIQRIVRRTIDEYGKIFTLNSPRLSYFNDMTNFIEWDGITNPFPDRALEIPSVSRTTDRPGTRSGMGRMLRFFQNLLREKEPELPSSAASEEKPFETEDSTSHKPK